MKERGHSLHQAGPCLSFGCQCAVCKSHLSNMRRAGDVNAIKAFQDEVNFRTFAAQTNSMGVAKSKSTRKEFS